jgi:2'-5' RNA ligase
MKRLFIGIPVHAESAWKHVDALSKNQSLNRNHLNWVKPENWHITLFFLGDTQVSRIAQLNQFINESFEETHPLQTELNGAGVFPDVRNPKVLWMGLTDIQPLIPACKRLGDLLKQHAFDFDNKPLKPHLTIARIKTLEHRDSLRDLLKHYTNFNFGTVLFDRVTLFESILTPSGPVYKPLFEKLLR